MSKSVTIDFVAEELKKWRSNKQAKEPIPERIWQLVDEIYAHYPRGLIYRRLSMTKSQLERRGLIKPSEPAKVSQTVPPAKVFSDAFVSVSSAPTKRSDAPAEIPQSLSLEFHRCDGAKCLVQQLNLTQLSSLLRQWGG